MLPSLPYVGIVVPTIREDSITRFLKEWEMEFLSYPNLILFIVEDNPQKSFTLEASDKIKISHFSWADIDSDLGDKSWIIPRRTDCIRSYGYYKAYQEGVDILITLDDDCYPTEKEPYLIKTYISNLSLKVSTEWFNTINARFDGHNGFYPRGFPYEDRGKEVVLSHGLWDHIPDFDGHTQLANPDIRVKNIRTEASVVPRHILYPMCGMNVAVKREVIPIFYFLLMGKTVDDQKHGMDRFGDIWAGLFSKKIIDHLDKAVVSGQPFIHHDRASHPHKNIELEKDALSVNDDLYDVVKNITLTSNTYKDCYIELAEKIYHDHPYFKSLKQAMVCWISLF